MMLFHVIFRIDEEKYQIKKKKRERSLSTVTHLVTLCETTICHSNAYKFLV